MNYREENKKSLKILDCTLRDGGYYNNWDFDFELIKEHIEVIKSCNIDIYPIAEINSFGDFIITKPEGSGGLVNRETVCEQILYEMGDPKKYISPDVCVDFTSFDLNDLGGNRVHFNGVKGLKATDTYKVAISYFSGYKASGQLTISGPRALDKAQLTSDIIWKRLENIGCKFDEKSTPFSCEIIFSRLSKISWTKLKPCSPNKLNISVCICPSACDDVNVDIIIDASSNDE